MKKLLKTYNFESPSQYYDMVHKSKINGQHKQAKEQFKAMPKAYQKEMVLDLSQNSEEFIYFLKLL